MNDGQVWTALRRGWRLIALFLVLGLAVAVGYLRLAPSTYTGRADLYVTTAGSLTVSELSAGSLVAEAQARNLALIATRDRVLQPVVAQLNLDRSVNELGESIAATVPANSSVIQVEVQDRSPQDAATIANAVASSLVSTTEDLLPPARRGAPTLQVQVVQSAVAPSEPSGPNPLVSVVLGVVLGLLTGLGAALLAARRRRSSPAPAESTVQHEQAAAVRRPAGAAHHQGDAAWTWNAEQHEPTRG